MTTDSLFQGFTRKELSDAFDLVADPNDWRAPINTTLPRKGWAEDRALLARIEAAIEFFTATTPKFSCELDRLRIRARGYRAGPAGP